MLSEKVFKEQIAILSENFNFKFTPEYLKLVFGAIKHQTNDKILIGKIRGVLMNMKISDWNKDFGFGGRPAIADFIAMFCVVPKEIPCAPYTQFGGMRSSRLESIKEALGREAEYLMPKDERKALE